MFGIQLARTRGGCINRPRWRESSLDFTWCFVHLVECDGVGSSSTFCYVLNLTR